LARSAGCPGRLAANGLSRPAGTPTGLTAYWLGRPAGTPAWLAAYWLVWFTGAPARLTTYLSNLTVKLIVIDILVNIVIRVFPVFQLGGIPFRVSVVIFRHFYHPPIFQYKDCMNNQPVMPASFFADPAPGPAAGNRRRRNGIRSHGISLYSLWSSASKR
jgi:hypothetical protein